ncbi:MAG: epoxyqueuosine reductase QueH [Kiritimatiellae bacterium]|nr:epoxyqueuosine reductase QueH [Kiritimatiellia bacterium]
MKVLLHACCGTCASHCVMALRDYGHDVRLFFSNGNIAPDSEFHKRLDTLRRLADCLNVPLIVDEPDHKEWLELVAKGFEQELEKGARCERCFRYSLERTFRMMEQQGLDMFTTTLSVSPHKHTPSIFKVGQELDRERFLAVNFKKEGGFRKSMQMSESLGLYRQNYCGCEFSIRVL